MTIDHHGELYLPSLLVHQPHDRRAWTTPTTSRRTSRRRTTARGTAASPTAAATQTSAAARSGTPWTTSATCGARWAHQPVGVQPVVRPAGHLIAKQGDAGDGHRPRDERQQRSVQLGGDDDGRWQLHRAAQLRLPGPVADRLQNRAFLQFGVRVDKNSSFGTSAPAFVLPKVGGTWTISEEQFFSPLTKYVNTLRFCAARGAPPAARLSPVMRPHDARRDPLQHHRHDQRRRCSGQSWQRQPEAGARRRVRSRSRHGLLERPHLRRDSTYFHKTTNDLIIRGRFQPSLGFNTNPLANIGQVVNKGLELGMSVNAIRLRNLRMGHSRAARTRCTTS